MSYPAACAQSSTDGSSRDEGRDGTLLKQMKRKGVVHGTLRDNCIFGLVVGVGLIFNQGEIKVYESWMRQLLLKPEIGRFNDM